MRFNVWEMRFILVVAGISFCSACQAQELTAEKMYRALEATPNPASEPLQVLLRGMEMGFVTANGQLRRTGRDLIYCQPETQTLTMQDIQEVFIREYEGPQWSGFEAMKTFPPSVILLEGLRSKFPCKPRQ